MRALTTSSCNCWPRPGGDTTLAEIGLILLDEADKVRRQDSGGVRDISGLGASNPCWLSWIRDVCSTRRAAGIDRDTIEA